MKKETAEQLNRGVGLLKTKKPRVAIAMSGGVDSSVAAKILIDQGYDVVGFMMKLWSDPSCPAACPRENACCDDQGVMDAKKVADKIGIPFYLVNAKEIFKKEVVDYFIKEYKDLRTPNPCVMCNNKIKFGWLLDFIKKTGCDYLATGHYARIVASEKQDLDNLISYQLLKGVDANKDQSYFLYDLNQDQLSKIMFPVGGFTKEEVRTMAEKWELPVFEKRESQEICFIQDKDFRDFLKRNIPEKYFKPGDIIDLKGNIIGKHSGLINYTIGQRKNVNQELRIMNHEDKQALYVIGFNQEKNQLIVGEDRDIYKNKMVIKDAHFIQNQESIIKNHGNLRVKIRYRHHAVSCTTIIHDSKFIIQFDEPQRAITPGQSAVFYCDEEVLGGGIIQ